MLRAVTRLAWISETWQNGRPAGTSDSMPLSAQLGGGLSLGASVSPRGDRGVMPPHLGQTSQVSGCREPGRPGAPQGPGARLPAQRACWDPRPGSWLHHLPPAWPRARAPSFSQTPSCLSWDTHRVTMSAYGAEEGEDETGRQNAGALPGAWPECWGHVSDGNGEAVAYKAESRAAGIECKATADF